MRNAEAKNPFYDLLSYCAGYGKTISIRNNNMELYLSALKVNENIVLYPGNLDAAITSLLEQLKSAKESILVILPDSNFDIQCGELIFSELSAARQRGISTRLLAKELDELLPKWQQISESFSDAVCPLICIDDHIIWYGLPQPYGYFREKEDRNHNRIFNTSMHVAVAIKGKRTIKVIKEFLRLKNMEAVLQPQTETAGTVNLAKYISENVKCPACHAPMLLKQSFKGKPYLQCSSCKATGLLTPDTINDYMGRYNILCPEHGCRMNAGVGKFGIYIRCICGHFINPNQL